MAAAGRAGTVGFKARGSGPCRDYRVRCVRCASLAGRTGVALLHACWGEGGGARSVTGCRRERAGSAASSLPGCRTRPREGSSPASRARPLCCDGGTSAVCCWRFEHGAPSRSTPPRTPLLPRLCERDTCHISRLPDRTILPGHLETGTERERLLCLTILHISRRYVAGLPVSTAQPSKEPWCVRLSEENCELKKVQHHTRNKSRCVNTNPQFLHRLEGGLGLCADNALHYRIRD